MVVETAKALVASIEVDDARLVRFTGYGSFAFGVVVEATRTGFNAFTAAVAAKGLLAEMHRFFTVGAGSKLEPIYGYEITIYIPFDWKAE